MIVKDLIEILRLRRLDEEVIAVSLSSGQRLDITGVSENYSQRFGCVALGGRWMDGNGDAVEGAIGELDKVREEAQIEAKTIREQNEQLLERMTKLEKKCKPKRKKPRKKPRTDEEIIAAGYIPTGKRGRPARIDKLPTKAEKEKKRRELLLSKGIDPDADF